VAGDRGRSRVRHERREPEHRLRNLAILRLLWATGLRRTELCLLEVDDVDLRLGVALVRHAKGKKTRVVPFDAAAKAALAEYLVQVRGREPGPLFLARRGVALSPDALTQLVGGLSRRAGLSLGVHAFRRGFAVQMRRAGLEMDSVQTLMGHASAAMTRVYSASGEEEAALRAYRQRVG